MTLEFHIVLQIRTELYFDIVFCENFKPRQCSLSNPLIRDVETLVSDSLLARKLIQLQILTMVTDIHGDILCMNGWENLYQKAWELRLQDSVNCSIFLLYFFKCLARGVSGGCTQANVSLTYGFSKKKILQFYCNFA